jgi:hypothetical protein
MGEGELLSKDATIRVDALTSSTQKLKLMEESSQSNYTLQHPHSRAGAAREKGANADREKSANVDIVKAHILLSAYIYATVPEGLSSRLIQVSHRYKWVEAQIKTLLGSELETSGFDTMLEWTH